MKFHEKLQRRVRDLGINKARAARDAGLPESTISSYVTRTGSLPRIDIAAKIATALKVPLAWLADDAQDWPPPAAADRGLADVPYTELARELARRYRLEMLDALAALDRAEREDWDAAAAAVRALKPGVDPPPNVARLLAFQGRVIESVATVTMRYDVRIAADFMHEQLPGGDRPVESVQYAKAVLRLNDLEARDGFGGLLRWSLDHPDTLRRIGAFTVPVLTANWLMQLTQEHRRGELLTKPAKAVTATTAGGASPTAAPVHRRTKRDARP